MRVLDLFSGIGGFSLGLERAGFETVAFCEIEPFPRQVLAKHWPGVPIYDDVRTLTAERLAADGVAVDVICGGFPCQDISTAGRGAGLAGERSGLWSEIARLVCELRPRYVVVENVSALLGRGLGVVLGDLAEIGYDAEWHCVPAAYLGGHHIRDRVWIVAYPDSNAARPLRFRNAPSVAGAGVSLAVLANPVSQRQQGPGELVQSSGAPPIIDRETANALSSGLGSIWRTEPDVGRVAHGVPDRSHRLKALGNAVVPQIPELIGRAIMAAEASRLLEAA
jgi:DNA (cytosine-5)-methyltransferase 1